MVINANVDLKKQQGVVLVVALVFLIALTAVASALMLNTTTDMKMSGASQQKVVATQEAVSSVDEVIFTQRNASGGNRFAAAPSTFPINNISVRQSDAIAAIRVANANNLITDCPPSRLASSVQVFKCNTLIIRSVNNYGHKDRNSINVNAGIAQQILNVGN